MRQVPAGVIGRVRAAYDVIAPFFAGRVKDRRQSVERFANELAERLGSGARVLDLGCGPGYDTARFDELGLRPFGGDLSGGMLAEARMATGRPLAQLDMAELPFRDGSFAGIWCIAALLHVPKAEAPATLAEMRRVCARAGFWL